MQAGMIRLPTVYEEVFLMGRMENNGFAPAMFMQGGRDNGYADASYGNNVCSDCDSSAAYTPGRMGKGCDECDNNTAYGAGYPGNGCDECDGNASRRSKGCTCDNDGATHIYFDACENSKEVTVIGSCEEDSLGRVLDVNVTLRNVCPGRCSSLGINLSEMDDDGTEYARGFRAISVPAHNARTNQDIQLDAVRFVLPEDRRLQRRRHLIVRTTHHYLDDGSI